MVVPIDIKAGAQAARAVSSANNVVRVASVQTARKTETVVDTAASALTRELAAAPPIDTARIAEIRKAIAEGRFPLAPSKIADHMLALKLQWNPNE